MGYLKGRKLRCETNDIKILAKKPKIALGLVVQILPGRRPTVPQSSKNDLKQ